MKTYAMEVAHVLENHNTKNSEFIFNFCDICILLNGKQFLWKRIIFICNNQLNFDLNYWIKNNTYKQINFLSILI